MDETEKSDFYNTLADLLYCYKVESSCNVAYVSFSLEEAVKEYFDSSAIFNFTISDILVLDIFFEKEKYIFIVRTCLNPEFDNETKKIEIEIIEINCPLQTVTNTILEYSL